jgi:hypothetical protein
LLLTVLIAQAPVPSGTPLPWFMYYVHNTGARREMLAECRRLSLTTPAPVLPPDVTTQCIAAAHAEAIVRQRRVNGGPK